MSNTLENITEVNGKKLTKSQINLLVKLAAKFSVTMGDSDEERKNPYTGASHVLCPLAVALYDFIVNSYKQGLVKGSTFASLSNPKAIPTAIWDKARYLFLALWPDEYYDLID